MNELVRAPSAGALLASQRTPFAGPIYRAYCEPNATLAQMIERIPFEHLPPAFATHGVVRINGQEIHRPLWRVVRPKDGAIVTVEMRMQGGGGGGGKGKNIFALLAMIAVIAIATIVSAGTFGLGTGIFAAGAFGAKALALGITVAGQLLISALTKPPTPKPGRKEDTTDFGNASANGNVLAPGGAITRVIGTHRVFPPLACQGFVETVGDDQFAELTLVLAGPHKLEDIQIDGVSIADMQEVLVDTREGWANDPPLSLITRITATRQPSVAASQVKVDKDSQQHLQHQATPELDYPHWHRVRSYQNPDQIRVGLVWSQGLYDADAPTLKLAVPVRFRIRHVGDTDWFNLPEVHFTNAKANLYRKDVIFTWDAVPVPLDAAPTSEGPYAAFATVPPQDVATPVQTDGWTAHPIFNGTGGGYNSVSRVGLNKDNVIFYIPDGVFSKEGIFEIEIMRGYIYYTGNFTPATYVLNVLAQNNVKDLFRSFIASATYCTGYDYSGVSDKLTINSCATIWNEVPVAQPGLATIQIRAKNRDLQNVSVLASGYVRDWDGTGWTDWTTTSNPAPHYRDVMAGLLNARQVPSALIDDDGLVDWREYCDTYGWTCNALIEGNTVAEVLDVIASCGRARPRAADKWGVIVDRYRFDEPEVQIFTPLNSTNLGFSKAFTRLPDGFIVTYRDRTNDYAQAETVVFRPGVIEGSASNLEAISVVGLVDEHIVADRARFDLTQLTKRAMQFTLDVDIEALRAIRGDIVGLQHDILTLQAGWARIVQVLFNGAGLVSGVELDQPVTVNDATPFWDVTDFWAMPDIWMQGLQTGAMIRGEDGSIVTNQVSADAGSQDVIGFTTPFVMPTYTDADGVQNALMPGCLVVTGPLGQESRRLIITDIKMGPDLNASLTLVDEAPDLTITERGTPFDGGAYGDIYFAEDIGFQ